MSSTDKGKGVACQTSLEENPSGRIKSVPLRIGTPRQTSWDSVRSHSGPEPAERPLGTTTGHGKGTNNASVRESVLALFASSSLLPVSTSSS